MPVWCGGGEGRPVGCWLVLWRGDTSVKVMV